MSSSKVISKQRWQADAFWCWSLDVYAKKNVQQSCLRLQDEHACNVNLLLLCVYVQQHGCELTQPDFMALQNSIKSSESALLAQRQLRRQTKSIDKQAYQRLLEQELVLERAQQAELIAQLNTLTLHKAECSAKTSNLHCYLRSIQDIALKKVEEYIYLFHSAD